MAVGSFERRHSFENVERTISEERKESDSIVPTDSSGLASAGNLMQAPMAHLALKGQGSGSLPSFD